MNYRFDDDGNVLPPIPKTILEINSYIKALVEEEALLQDVYAVGEISNFKNHYATGHFYLTLKDSQSEIRAVMFRSYARKLKFVPQDGMKVFVHGRIGVIIKPVLIKFTLMKCIRMVLAIYILRTNN